MPWPSACIHTRPTAYMPSVLQQKIHIQSHSWVIFDKAPVRKAGMEKEVTLFAL